MWNWLRNLFKREPAPPRFVDVGRADITVTTEDKEYKLWYQGWYHGLFMSEDLVTHARERVNDWLNTSGARHMMSVGEDQYIPLSSVKDVRVVYSECPVQARD